MMVGEGGAAAVLMTSRRGSGSVGAASELTSEISTVGAAQKWVTPSSRTRRQTSAGSSLRRQTWVAPMAVVAQG